jgi:hypothetical protein
MTPSSDKHTLYILINFSYIIIFGILTAAVTLLNMPKKENSLKNYRISLYILGIATGLMAVYCIFRLIIPQHHGDYIDFWLLVSFTLLFSWLTYASFLFMIETPRYLIKNFIADGLIPFGFMLVSGFIGILIPAAQKVMMVIFGCIYSIKCAWMLYTCLKEYLKCRNEIENYYDEGPDMKWMSFSLILSFILYISTIIVFYIHCN